MMSLRTIDSGAFQYGLTMISLIFEFTIGVWRSILPTIAVWRSTTRSFSTASIWAAGMLTIT